MAIPTDMFNHFYDAKTDQIMSMRDHQQMLKRQEYMARLEQEALRSQSEPPKPQSPESNPVLLLLEI